MRVAIELFWKLVLMGNDIIIIKSSTFRIEFKKNKLTRKLTIL